MGSPNSEFGRCRDEVQREVSIMDFQMQSTQVTQKQWARVMGNKPSYFKGDDRPVENISFDEVQEFLKRLNKKMKKFDYRLPTEEEWEYACRAGTTTPYFCEFTALKYHAWFYDNSGSKTHPVALKYPNKRGLYDMHGNVWEWTSSLYSSKGSYRVLRGGSWDGGAQLLRSALRNYGGPGYRGENVGFRLVRTPCNPSVLLPSSDSSSQSREAVICAALTKIKDAWDLIRGLK